MKRNILVLNLAVIFLWMSMYTYVPTLTSYATSLGATAAMIGAIGGAYGIMQIALRVPLGILSDKIGRDRLILLIGFVILVFAAVLFIVVHDVFWVMIARGVSGAAAAWWVVICSSYAKFNAEENQVKAQGMLNASSNGGKVVAALAGGLLAQAFGLHAPFYFALIAALVGLGCILLFQTPRESKKIVPPSGKELLSLLKNKDMMVFSILAIFGQILSFAFPSYFTSEAAKLLGADSSQLGMLMVVYFLFSAVSSLFVGTKAYKKLGGIKCLALCFLTGALTCIPAFYHMNLAVIYVMQAVSGIGYGIILGALAGFVIKSVTPKLRSTAMGAFQSIYAIGIFLGPVIVGNVMEVSTMDTAFWVVFALMLAATVLTVALIPKEYDKM